MKKYWFIIFFVLTLAFPVYGGSLEQKLILSGVTSKEEPMDMTLNGLAQGSYQNYLNNCWENNFSGRKILLKVRNQLLYGVFGVSPNSNVIIGADEYLFEPEYVLQELKILEPASQNYFEELGANLFMLNSLLTQNGKELYVFITPSKAHFCKDKIPQNILWMENKEYDYSNYSKLIEELDKNKIHYFDSIAYLEQNYKTGLFQAPLFYASGIHWSHVWGEACAAEFLAQINAQSKFDLASVYVTEQESEGPVWPDTDLSLSLNLLEEVKDSWFVSEMKVLQEGKSRPNIFMRGGSFLGQSLEALVRCNIFGKDVHFENNYYFTKKYSEVNTLSGFDAYDEMDLDVLMGQSDILVLEVNECAIPNMSWGFIQYLLEHSECLDTVFDDNELNAGIWNWDDLKIQIQNSMYTEENPWNFTAGKIQVDEFGECIFLTPGTTFSIENVEMLKEISIWAEIHPWVAEASDGAEIEICYVDKWGEISSCELVFIKNTDSWIKVFECQKDMEKISEIKVTCNNGLDICADWVIFHAIKE